jgi:inner membrane protease ATP23
LFLSVNQEKILYTYSDIIQNMLDETTPFIRNCYDQARQCIASNESIRRLLDALSSHGCPFNLNRHLTCETNHENLRGGFDCSTCQIVLYPENVHSLKEFCSIFQHELIHAYDYCRADIDFNNPYHLACTEIRAASLSNQCSLFNYLSTSSRPFLLKNQHATCVRNRTRESMDIILDHHRRQNLNQIINDVFLRCYNDTDPFDEFERGRRGH